MEDASVGVRKLDPVVNTLRLGLDSIPDSRLEPGPVTMEVVQGSLFVQEEAIVTASALLDDGRRLVINDASELVVTTSNSSVVSVSGTTVVAEDVGVAYINVSWTVCGSVLGSETIEIEVGLDLSQPVFVPDTQAAEVPEDSPIGHLITTVRATTEAGDEAEDVQYRFQNGINYNGLFLLDQTTGEVTLNGPLDRETVDSYVLLVEATNQAQRRAELGEPTEEGGDSDAVSGSGSGSGSEGNGVLMPEPAPQGNTSLTIAVLTVSATDIPVGLAVLPSAVRGMAACSTSGTNSSLPPQHLIQHHLPPTPLHFLFPLPPLPPPPLPLPPPPSPSLPPPLPPPPLPLSPPLS